MKLVRAFTLILCLIVSPLLASNASTPGSDRWQLIGPYGGPLGAIEFHPVLPNVAFASGTDSYFGSFYRTTDSGRSWVRMSPRGRCLVRAHPKFTQYVLAICAQSVYLSTNLGETWMYQSQKPFGNKLDAEFDPENPSLIYLAMGESSSHGGILYRSNDAGRSWKQYMRGLAEKFVRSQIEIDPFDRQHLYLLAADGVFVSTNSGSSWVHLRSSISPESFQENIPILKVDPSDSRTLYLLQENSLIKSTDGGGHWSVLRYPTVRAISLSVAEGGRVLYGDYREISRSENGGNSWTHISIPQTWPESTVNFAALDPHNTKRMFICLPVIGLLKSDDNGYSWQKTFGGISELSSGFVEIADTQPLRILAPVSTGWDHLAVTTTNGSSWRLFTNMRYDYALTIFPRNPRIWAAGSEGKLALTQNAGKTWTFHPLLNEEFAYDLEFDPFDPAAIFAATNTGVQRTTDSGATWTHTTTVLDNNNPYVIEADPGRKGVFFSSTFHELSRTTDSGGKWEQVATTGCGNNDIEDIQVNPFDSNDVFYVTSRRDVNVSCSHIFRSSDGGSTWRAMDLPPTYGGFYGISFDPVERGTLFLFPEYGGLYTSRDDGKTWSLYNLKGSRQIFRMAFSVTRPGLLAGASFDGIFLFQRSSGSGMTLDQMYPNPAHAGGEVTLFGHGFGSTGALYMGPNRIVPRSWNDTQIRFLLPADARTASLRVVRGADSVSQELLVLDGSLVYPNNGPASGGTRVVIRLHRVYDSSVMVQFGNKIAPIAQQVGLNFQYTKDGSALILATTPPGSGVVNVYVNSTFGPTRVGQFTYRQD